MYSQPTRSNTMNATKPTPPWDSSRPIVSQADMDRAVNARAMIKEDIRSMRMRHPDAIAGAFMMLKKIDERISESNYTEFHAEYLVCRD